MAAIDLFGSMVVGGSSPATHAVLITPSDAEDLAYATRGISFAVDGALKVTMVGGETVTIPSGALAAGIIHPIRATRVWAVAGTATGIVGYY